MKRSFFVFLVVGLTMAGLMLPTSSAQNRTSPSKGAPVSVGEQQEVLTERPVNHEQSSSRVDLNPGFETLAQDLVRMHFLFKGGNGIPVIFDSRTARSQGYSDGSIRLAEELAAYTNELTRAAMKSANPREASVAKLNVGTQRYARMTSFFSQAAKRDGTSVSKDDDSSVSIDKGPSILALGIIGIAEYECGSFSRPLPNRSATPREHYSRNPAQTLASWGYHRTPDYAGGGWTRPRTYKWWVCGWNTFRDDAWTLIRRPNYIQEQNYSGWTPNGEPNPEVWRSGPWPYATWPAYVAWWHKTR